MHIHVTAKRTPPGGALIPLLSAALWLGGCLQEPVRQADEPEPDGRLSYAAATAPSKHMALYSTVLPMGSVTWLDDGSRSDWAHFGQSTASTISRKAGVPVPLIIKSSSGTVTRFSPGFTYPKLKWTNGASPDNALETGNGIAVSAVGNYFSFAGVDAHPGPARVLYAYVSAYRSVGRITAAFTDGTPPMTLDIMPQPGTEFTTYRVHIPFVNQYPHKVTLKYEMISNLSGGMSILHAVSYGAYSDNTVPTRKPVLPYENDTWVPAVGGVLPLSLQDQSTSPLHDPDGILQVEYWINGRGRLGVATAPPWTYEGYVETIAGVYDYYTVIVDKFGKAVGGTAVPRSIWMVKAVKDFGSSAPIPDGNGTGVSFQAPISNASGRIQEVRAIVNLTHPNVQELTIYLNAYDQSGNHLGGNRLFARTGGAGANMDQTWFANSASKPIWDGVPPYAWKAYQPYDFFRSYATTPANGSIWKFTVVDAVYGFTGSVQALRILVKPGI